MVQEEKFPELLDICIEKGCKDPCNHPEEMKAFFGMRNFCREALKGIL